MSIIGIILVGKIRLPAHVMPKDNINTSRQTKLDRFTTPAMPINGQEWCAWHRDDISTERSDNAGQLNVTMEHNTLSARYQTSLPKNQTLVLNIAILGFDLTSHINKGENNGRTLAHDFVVLGYRTVAMQPGHTGFNINATALSETALDSKRTAIATWVNTFKNPAPIQATGGWLN